MKAIYTLLLILGSYPSIAQTRNFSYIIDNKTYSVTETDLNDHFSKAFDEMVKRGVVKESDFDSWVKTYTNWKAEMYKGTQSMRPSAIE